MQDKSKFHCMLNWSHVAAAIFKALFGYVGFLTFQEDTSEEVVNNLPQGLKVVVNLILVVKALLSYPLPYYAACELIEWELFKVNQDANKDSQKAEFSTFLQGKPETRFPTIWSVDGDLKVWGLGFRVAVVVLTILFAIVIPHFTILMGFIGSFTGCCLSFIWPAMFHLKLRRHTMSWMVMVYDIFIVFLGLFFGLTGMYYSGMALKKAFVLGVPV